MLGRSYRVRKEDFKDVLARGRFLHCPFVMVRFLNQNRKQSRLAVVVPKSVSKSAVVRNKVKRRIWGVLEAAYPSLLTSCDIIFFAKKGSERARAAELKEMVLTLLAKANLFSNGESEEKVRTFSSERSAENKEYFFISKRSE